MSKTEGVGKKKFVALLLRKHRATFSGMSKSGGSAKTVFNLLLFTQLCRTGNFCFWQFVYYQGYHRSTPKNKHAEVRLPKSQKLFNVKALKIGEDQIKRSSRPQSPNFPLKIGED